MGNSTSKTIEVPKGPLGRRATILVVDDEELVRCVTQELLACLGYDSVVASNGEEALDKIRAGLRPDLILLDIVMPVMGGVEAFRRIRALDPEIPIFLSSGFTDPETTATLLKEGLNGVIAKPYRMESLSARIREALRPSGA